MCLIQSIDVVHHLSNIAVKNDGLTCSPITMRIRLKTDVHMR